MTLTIAALAPGAPAYAHRVQDVLRKNASRFDGRTDLVGEKGGAFLKNVRTILSPQPDPDGLSPDWVYATDIASHATSLRIVTVRGLMRMARVNPRTRTAVAQTVAVIRDLHNQVLQAIEEDS